jgi:hypothetical protein
MSVEIPVFQTLSSNWESNILLENKRVIFKIKYNIRNDYFALDFTDGNGDTVYGIKIVPDWPLLKYRKGFIEFFGDIFVLAKQENPDPLDYDNLGNVYGLYYLTEEEVQAWEEENGI